MAISRTPEQFARRLRIIAKKVQENTLKNVKRAAVAADQAAVFATPVDTGRARGNWLASLGVPLYEYNEDKQDGNAALARARATIGRYRLGGGGIYLTNSVPYIVPLNSGWSAQAPIGMTGVAIQAARKQFGEAKLLEGV